MTRSVLLGFLVLLVGVLDAQNVGVGTTTPTHNLHVVGTIRFESLGSIGPAGKAILLTDNQGVVNIVEFTGNPGDVLLGDASWGNLSVLTTVNSQFPIVGDGSTSNPITFANGNNAGQVWIWNGSSWQLVVLGTAVGNAGYDSVCASAASNFVQKWTGTELCNTIIYEDGTNVGIGTASPTHKLHVNGSVRISSLSSGSNGAIVISNSVGALNITNFTGNTGDVLRGDGTFGPVSLTPGVVSTSGPVIGDGTSGNPITFASGLNAGEIWQWNGSSWQLVTLKSAVAGSGFDSVCSSASANIVQKWTGTELCNTIIYENGNGVGIGTTAPTARFQIQAPSTYANPLFVIRHDTNSASNPFFIVTKDGRVGVGTNAPVMKFEIDYPTASPAFVVTSDIRLKKDIVPLSSEGNVLDKIENLRGVYYYWNETYRSMGKGNDRRQIGLIAQEVMVQFPELVYEWADGSGYYMVDYEKMVPVLLEAIKELKGKLEQEQQKNSQLQSRIDQLEQEIEEIKNHIKAFSSRK